MRTFVKEHKMDLNAVTKGGDTPLISAIRGNNTETVRVLVEELD